MRIVISQPRYLPFVPYLQRLKNSDLFVFLDDVQRQSRGFENRNKIIDQLGAAWLTIPIASSSRALICDSYIGNNLWIETHKQHIDRAYRTHEFYSKDAVEFFFDDLPIMQENMLFSDNVIKILVNICRFFDFEPNWIKASSLDISHTKSGPMHLADIARKVGATEYISGANGREYGVGEVFENVCHVSFHCPSAAPYGQLFSKVHIPFLAFIDELFSCGKDILKEKIYHELQIER